MPSARPYWPGPERQSAWRGSTATSSAATASSSAASTLSTQTPPEALPPVVHHPARAAAGKILEEDSCGPFQPLLKVSRPVPVGAVEGRYAVLIRRAAQTQPFGLTLLAEEGLQCNLEGVRAAEDLPHLGIGRDDEVVLINGVAPRSAAECHWTLQEAMSLLLVMQRVGPESKDYLANGGHGNHSADGDSSGLMQVPLAVTRPVVTDLARGEFQLAVQRSSLTQKFGVSFNVDGARAARSTLGSSCRGSMRSSLKVPDDMPTPDRFSRASLANRVRKSLSTSDERSSRFSQTCTAEVDHGRGARIVVSVDAPHLGLCEGDRLLVINGLQPESEAGCRLILHNSRILRLTLVRSPEKLACMAALPLIPLDDEDEEAGRRLETRQVMGCDATGGLQEEYVSVDLPPRSGGGGLFANPLVLCALPCVTGTASGARVVEPEEQVFGWDAMGGQLEVPGVFSLPGRETSQGCSASGTNGTCRGQRADAGPQPLAACRPGRPPPMHGPEGCGYPAVVCSL